MDKVESIAKHDKCPVCGCEKGLVKGEVKKEIEAGKMSEGAVLPVLVTQALLFEPAKNSNIIIGRRLVPVVVCNFEVCADCGTMYLSEAVKSEMLVEAKPQNGMPQR